LRKEMTCLQALDEIEGIIDEIGVDARASRACRVQNAERALDLVRRCREYLEKTGEGAGSLPEGGRKMNPVKSTEKDLGL
jgi:hypothetical protein